MDNKKKEKLLNLGILAPCLFENWIFVCFGFTNWRRDMPDEIQLRIFWGSLVIALAFFLYYFVLLVIVFRYYKQENRKLKLGSIVVCAAIGVLSYCIGYFM